MLISKFPFLKQQKSKNPKLRIKTLNTFGLVLIFSIFVGSFLFVKSASAADHPFISDSGTLIDGFEDVNDWTVTGTGATAENDTSIFKVGTQSIELNATGGNRAYLTKTVSLDLSSEDGISFWYYTTDSSKLNKIKLSFSSDPWSKYFYVQFYGSYIQNGWNYLQLNKADFTAGGGESWDNTIVSVRVEVAPLAGEAASVNFDDLRFGIVGQPKVILSFDDGKAGVINKAYPIMEVNDQRGVAFIYTNVVGDSNIMTLAELTTLKNAGWDISNHTEAHKDLTAVSQEEMEADIDGGYDWLVANGFGDTAKFFAYPYGHWNDAVVTKLKQRHILARAIATSDFGMHFDIINFEDLQYKLRGYYVSSDYSVANVQAIIDSTIARSGLLIMFFHDIVDSGATGGSCLTANFQAISDYLKEKQDAVLLEVITFSDYYNSLIYDTPDTGFSLYTIGTNEIDIGAGARIYGDGKFRNISATSGSTADLTITPESGSFSSYGSTEVRPAWMDVSISTWSNTGTHQKTWTESSTVSGLTNTVHTVGDLEANKYYNVKVDDSIENLTGTNCNTVGSDFVCYSNSEGKITFTYTGTYSDHTFDVEEGDNTPPVLTEVIPVSSPTNDPTPDYTFNTTEAGTIAYGGDCSSSTTSAISGDNTITFNTLSEGTYSNCTITVTDAIGNASAALSVTSFTIDTTAPVRSSGSPSGTLAWNTTSATLSLIANETATCKYGVSSGMAYDSIANTFTTTGGGGTSHSASLTGLSSNRSYAYYVRCQDSAGNINIDDYQISFSVAAAGGGGLPSVAYNPPSPPTPSPENPQGGFKVLINNGVETTNNRVVTLKLFGGSDTVRMAISRAPDFSPGEDTGQISYQNSYTWDLCYGQKKCPLGVYTVYVKFYTQWGQSSEVVSDSIVLTSIEPQVFVEQMTTEEIKAKIFEIRKKIIDLLQQLIQLIQERITQLQARLL